MTDRILVTGGAGFIGARIIEELLERTDAHIVSLDRLDTSGTLERLAHLAKGEHKDRLTVVFHDLKAELNDRVRTKIGNITHIYHLAAGSHVDRSIEYPMEFVFDNVVGTGNLLEFARKHCSDLKWFLYFSTDEVFGPAPTGVAYKEWDRYNSGNPYSAAKAGAEELCLAFANTYRMPINITHTMNVFGVRQHPEKYIPICIRKTLKGEKITIHANKDCTKAGSRFYISVDDVADAMLFLLAKHEKGELKNGDKFNVVGSEEIDNLALAQRIADIQGKELVYEMVDFHSSRPGHDLRYALCGEKMKAMGWQPKPLTDRLIETVEWYAKPENNLWLDV